MLLTLPLLLQATASPPPADFDLAKLAPSDLCDSDTGTEEIVVCARRDDVPLAAATSDFEPPAEVPGPGIGFILSESARVNVFADGATLPSGFISNRAMLTLTIGF